MAEYRWYDVLNEITKVERKYNIKNPNWDNGFPGVFKDYGFVPVDSKGDWWTRIPDSPELPIIYAPVANTRYSSDRLQLLLYSRLWALLLHQWY